MPGALESSDGGSPETTTHDEKTNADASELSPEEQAISGLQSDAQPDPIPDENEETAALAEGRAEPPAASRVFRARMFRVQENYFPPPDP